MNRGVPIVLCGPSGVGKSTVLKKLFEFRDNFTFSVSATTRGPRNNEREGIDYFFMNHDSFKKLIDDDELLEYAEFAGNYYGSPRKPVEENLDKGLDVIFDIEARGARQVKEKMPEVTLVFMMTESIEKLEDQLRKRGTETEEEIQKRMSEARWQIEQLDIFDYFILNDTPENAAHKLLAIIDAQHCKIKDAEAIKENLL